MDGKPIPKIQNVLFGYHERSSLLLTLYPLGSLSPEAGEHKDIFCFIVCFFVFNSFPQCIVRELCHDFYSVGLFDQMVIISGYFLLLLQQTTTNLIA